MPLYFAYGLNMDPAGMAQRCPRSKPLGLARLPRHRIGVDAMRRQGSQQRTRPGCQRRRLRARPYAR
mgnify:CR=1 FL=1